MSEVRIKKLDSNYIYIDYDMNLSQLINDYFFFNTITTGEVRYLSKTDYVDGDPVIKFRAGFYDQLIKFLILKGFNPITEDPSIKTKGEVITINEKWKNILDSDYRVIEGKNQYQYLTEMLKFNRACGQFYTSYGKTELILATVESYLEANPDKNAVVFVPDNTIKNELIERSNKWDLSVKPGYHSFKSRFQLINPIGIMKNTALKNGKEEIINFLNNVGLVFIDEVHHLCASTYTEFLEIYLRSYTFIYGISGTLDPEEGKVPSFKSDPSDSNWKMNTVIGFLGLPRVHVKNPTPLLISYLRVKGTKVPDKIKHFYQKAIKIFFNSPALYTKISAFLLMHKDRRMFLPIIEVKQGKSIVDKMTSVLGEKTCVLVSAKGTYPDVTQWGYTGVKDYMKNCPEFRLVVGTTAIYEGFDSDMINTVLLGVGKNQRMTVQPTGRGVRSDDIPMVLLPWDLSGTNPIVNKQTQTKFKKLKEEYVNHKFVSLE